MKRAFTDATIRESFSSTTHNPITMLPTTASRVYVAQNVTDEDNPNAVVHVEAFEIGQNDQNGDREGHNASDCAVMAPGGDHDDMNALFPVRLDQIPRSMQRVLTVCGLLSFVTSPGHPSKVHVFVAFAGLFLSLSTPVEALRNT